MKNNHNSNLETQSLRNNSKYYIATKELESPWDYKSSLLDLSYDNVELEIGENKFLAPDDPGYHNIDDHNGKFNVSEKVDLNSSYQLQDDPNNSLLLDENEINFLDEKTEKRINDLEQRNERNERYIKILELRLRNDDKSSAFKELEKFKPDDEVQPTIDKLVNLAVGIDQEINGTDLKNIESDSVLFKLFKKLSANFESIATAVKNYFINTQDYAAVSKKSLREIIDADNLKLSKLSNLDETIKLYKEAEQKYVDLKKEHITLQEEYSEILNTCSDDLLKIHSQNSKNPDDFAKKIYHEGAKIYILEEEYMKNNKNIKSLDFGDDANYIKVLAFKIKDKNIKSKNDFKVPMNENGNISLPVKMDFGKDLNFKGDHYKISDKTKHSTKPKINFAEYQLGLEVYKKMRALNEFIENKLEDSKAQDARVQKLYTEVVNVLNDNRSRENSDKVVNINAELHNSSAQDLFKRLEDTKADLKKSIAENSKQLLSLKEDKRNFVPSKSTSRKELLDKIDTLKADRNDSWNAWNNSDYTLFGFGNKKEAHKTRAMKNEALSVLRSALKECNPDKNNNVSLSDFNNKIVNKINSSKIAQGYADGFKDLFEALKDGSTGQLYSQTIKLFDEHSQIVDVEETVSSKLSPRNDNQIIIQSTDASFSLNKF